MGVLDGLVSGAGLIEIVRAMRTGGGLSALRISELAMRKNYPLAKILDFPCTPLTVYLDGTSLQRVKTTKIPRSLDCNVEMLLVHQSVTPPPTQSKCPCLLTKFTAPQRPSLSPMFPHHPTRYLFAPSLARF